MTKPNSEYAKKLTKKQTKEMIDVIKNTPSPTKPNNKWEIEYDGQFGGLTGEVIDKYDLDAIKLFISKTLQQQREEVIEEIKNHEFYIPQGHTTRYFKLDDKDLEFLKKENK